MKEFKGKFISLLARERNEEEFFNLRQKTMTVAQYETLFTKLFKYAPELVATDAKRRRHFLQGLNLEIQNALTTTKMESYVEMVKFT